MVIRISDVRNGQGDYASLDDRMLVLDFQAGHPEAFVEIHGRYGTLARHVCRRLLANSHDTDEAFQETMIRVFQGLYRFNGRYALQPWISRIATNVSLDMIRSRARRPLFDERAVEDHEHVDLEDGPEEAFERLVERDLVLSVLTDLPDTHRRALILRELEGHSHREIGTAMGISPSQAKALIHRAKGSFRRRWMEKAADRSGIAGIALLPLVWLVRLADAARRVADRAAHAAQAAQAAAPEVVSSAASSTVVSAGGSGLGERVLAAGMTLLVAGGVTVGATTIAKDRGNDDGPVRAEAPAPVVVAPAADPDVWEPQPRFDQRPPKEAQGPPEAREDAEAVEPSPSVAPSPEPTEAPSPEPTETPTPEPTPDPTPVIPPAPGWSGILRTQTSSEATCICGAPALLGGRSYGSTTGRFVFQQTVEGALLDAEGDAAWRMRVTYFGEAEKGAGTGGASFYIYEPHRTTQFEAFGVLGGVSVGRDGVTTLTFVGHYEMRSDTKDPSPIPHEGMFALVVDVWQDDATVFTAVLSLY